MTCQRKQKLFIALFLFASIIQGNLCGQNNWLGTIDGSIDYKNILTTGNNVLTIQDVYVWDNGEGVSPEGQGSNCSWYGMCHGPLGRIHIKIYGPDKKTLLYHTYLHGPWKTGENKFEWKDNEGLTYSNYGIYDWDWFSFDNIYIQIYESDPKKVIGFLRKHDTLIYLHVNRYSSKNGLRFSSHHIPILDLTTKNLGGPDLISYQVKKNREKVRKNQEKKRLSRLSTSERLKQDPTFDPGGKW